MPLNSGRNWGGAWARSALGLHFFFVLTSRVDTEGLLCAHFGSALASRAAGEGTSRPGAKRILDQTPSGESVRSLGDKSSVGQQSHWCANILVVAGNDFVGRSIASDSESSVLTNACSRSVAIFASVTCAGSVLPLVPVGTGRDVARSAFVLKTLRTGKLRSISSASPSARARLSVSSAFFARTPLIPRTSDRVGDHALLVCDFIGEIVVFLARVRSAPGLESLSASLRAGRDLDPLLIFIGTAVGITSSSACFCLLLVFSGTSVTKSSLLDSRNAFEGRAGRPSGIRSDWDELHGKTGGLHDDHPLASCDLTGSGFGLLLSRVADLGTSFVLCAHSARGRAERILGPIAKFVGRHAHFGGGGRSGRAVAHFGAEWLVASAEKSSAGGAHATRVTLEWSPRWAGRERAGFGNGRNFNRFLLGRAASHQGNGSGDHIAASNTTVHTAGARIGTDTGSVGYSLLTRLSTVAVLGFDFDSGLGVGLVVVAHFELSSRLESDFAV